MEIHVTEPMHNVHFFHHGYFVHEPLVKDRCDWENQTWQRFTEYIVLSLIKIFLCWGWAFWTFTWYILCPFKEFCPLTYSPDFSVSSLSSPWEAIQTISYFLRSNVDPYFWLSLRQMNNQVYCWKFCPLWNFSFTTLSLGHPPSGAEET